MNTINLVINEGSNGQVIKYFREGSPYIEWSVFSNALVIETVDLGDQPRLMISSQQSYSVLISDLQGQQHQESLNAVSASIHVVSQKNIVGVGRIASNFE